MRKQGRRWASLLLVLAMLMGTLSLPAYATKLVEGTNGRTIYLSTEITSEENEKIDTVEKGGWFAVRIHFSGNADTIEESAQNYNLFLQFDDTKMKFQESAEVSATDGPYTQPTANAEGNIVIMGWSSTNGITTGSGSKKVTHQSGVLAKILFEATDTLSASDFAAIKLVEGNATDHTKMSQYTVVLTPALDVSVKDGVILYDTSSEQDIKNALTVTYIDASGDQTPVTNFALDKTSLTVGSNELTVTANGISEKVTVQAVEDMVVSIEKGTSPRRAWSTPPAIRWISVA